MPISATFNIQATVLGRLFICLVHVLVFVLMFLINLPLWVLAGLVILLVFSFFLSVQFINKPAGASLFLGNGIWHYSKGTEYKQCKLKAYYLTPWIIKMQFQELVSGKNAKTMVIFADSLLRDQWRQIRTFSKATGTSQIY